MSKETLQKEEVWKRRAFVASTVHLENFRNYEALDQTLAPGFNVLAGPNAQGKTNFLESLHFVSTSRLLRGQRDAEAIREGADRTRVSVELSETGTQLGMSLERGSRKRATLNGVNLPRAADLLGRMPSVAITTADMEIVRGEPSERRLFLDLELSSLSAAYLRHFSLYRRALEQRNALLKDARDRMVVAEIFEPWEEQLAHHGEAIRNAREEFIGRLSPVTQAVHEELGGGERVSLGYAPKDEFVGEDELRSGLAQTRSMDIARGSTSLGPHRDDVAILVEGREARLYGSQGQQRTSVISLKVAVLQVATEDLGAPPLLLLDDILSDLDEVRRSRLVDAVLARAGQAVLTCTEAAAAGKQILELAQVLHVRNGVVTAG